MLKPPPAKGRPEGSGAPDLDLSRRALAGLLATGYAAFSRSAEARPIHTDEQGLSVNTVAVPEGGDSVPVYVARPEARGRFPAVIVISEVFGVHEYIRDVCRRLAKQGYVAAAPSLFFRADPANALPGLTDFAAITKIVGAAKNEQVLGDVGATLSWLQDQRFVDPRRLAITGFCWGGAVVWMSCERFPALKAGAAWYGRLAAPAPGSFMSDDRRKWPLDIAAEMKTPILALYGGKDQGIPAADIEKMRTALLAAGQTEDQLIVYPEAQHGFHADYRSSYDPEAAEDGWKRMLAFFKTNHVEPGARRGLFG
jgi:carboxymethylenebutenolidase